MSCKLSDKCDNVFACNVLRPEVELLGCNFYKPKKPMNNEEWLRSMNTEQLAEVLYRFYRDGRNDELQRYVSINKKSFIEWLKQPHKE